jgi:hypothetical protein
MRTTYRHVRRVEFAKVSDQAAADQGTYFLEAELVDLR